MAQVKNVARNVRDLNDGRVLAPDQTANDVDVDDPHNAALIADGDLEVVADVAATVEGDDGDKPAARRRRTATTNQED